MLKEDPFAFEKSFFFFHFAKLLRFRLTRQVQAQGILILIIDFVG